MELRPWEKLQELLPPLASYEFEALKASIAEHDVLQRILALPDGRIIDGYHRWKILGNKAPYDTLDLDEQTALLLGLAINVARRQMSPDQIKELRKRQKKIALELRKPHDDQPPMSQEKAAGILGVARRTIDEWEGISNVKDDNTYNPPDLRIKVAKKEQQEITERIAAGESQTKVAADYKISQPRVSQIAKKGKTGKASIPLPPPLEALWPSVKLLLLNQADRAVRLGLRDLRRGCIGYENHRVDKWVQEVSVCPEAVAALAKMEKAVEAAESLIKTAADQLKCVAQSMPTDPIPPSQDRQELLLINARQKNLAGYCAELGCWERAEEDGLCWVHGGQDDHTTMRESENNSPFAVMKSRVAVINSSYYGMKPGDHIYNLGVEKIAQYHRLRGDEVYAGPWVPMMLGRAVDKFYFSVIFTWDIPDMISQVNLVRTWGKEVEIGGPAATFMHKYIHTQTGIEPHYGLDDRFEHIPPLSWLKEYRPKMTGGDYKLTFSSRGCPHRCAWCGVKKVEPVALEYDEFPLAPMIGDNNILATSWGHQELVVNKLVNYGREIDINSGFDVRFFQEKHYQLYSRLRLKYWRFAWDSLEVEDDVRRVAAIMRSNGLDRHKVTFYELIGFPGQTPEECLYRLNTIIELGMNPYCMRFWPLNSLNRKYVAPGWTEHLLSKMQTFYQTPNLWMADSWENFKPGKDHSIHGGCWPATAVGTPLVGDK